MAAKPPIRDEEVERVLRLLAPLAADRSIVLVGGQAVAFWTRFLDLGDAPPALVGLASKDVDFEGSARAVRQAAVLLGGSARIAGIDDHTPNTGLVSFRDSDGVQREIDFIEAPLGLRGRDVRDTAVRLLIAAESGATKVPLWILHPERCMESRVYNVQILGYDSKQAVRQLAASIICAREWSRFLLEDRSRDEGDRTRAVLKLNERIFRKCLADLHFRALFAERSVDPFEAVLGDGERLPAQFRERRYPQLRERLSERRLSR